MRYLSLGLDGEGLRQFEMRGFDAGRVVLEVPMGDEVFSVEIHRIRRVTFTRPAEDAEVLGFDEAAEVIGRLFIAVGAFAPGTLPKEPRKKTEEGKTEDRRLEEEKRRRQRGEVGGRISNLLSSVSPSSVSRLKGGAK